MTAVYILVSIDTEEDNWRPTRQGITVENIRALPELHRFLRGLDLRPTYFVDHPVARESWSADILREIREEGGAEIGAHLHPWNTPPLDEDFLPRHTMCHNLPFELQRAKLVTLRDAIHEAVGARPVSFRTGRFGFGRETATALIETGFRADSSVTPTVDWRSFDEGPDFGNAPLHCYRLDGNGDVRVPAPGGPLAEVPLSCGFTRRPFGWRTAARRLLNAPRLRPLRLADVASWLGLVRPVIGTPENEPLEGLLALSRALLAEGVRHLHIFWHSPSLVPGLSPFVSGEKDRTALLRAIEWWVEEMAKLVSVQPATVTEAAEALAFPSAGEAREADGRVMSGHR